MKKAISIMLVLIMVCAIFIVPAHAQESGEVTPRSPVCAQCGGTMVPGTATSKVYFDYPGCTNNAMTHKHYYVETYSGYRCTACDYFLKGSLISKTGPYCIYD